MFLEILASSLGATFVQAWAASHYDEKALKSLCKAYSTHADAVALYERQKKETDDSLQRLVNRKRAIYSTRMQEFLDLYSRIHAIAFRPGKGIQELFSASFSTKETEDLRRMTLTSMQQLPEKELVARFLLLGIGDSMLAESKRTAQIADAQARIADTMYAQAETMCVILEAMKQRADQFSRLLAELGKRFGQYLQAAKEIIDRNGADGDRYSNQEMAVLTNCINFAHAIKQYLDIPILDRNGSVTESSLKALDAGNETLRQFQALV